MTMPTSILFYLAINFSQDINYESLFSTEEVKATQMHLIFANKEQKVILMKGLTNDILA